MAAEGQDDSRLLDQRDLPGQAERLGGTRVMGPVTSPSGLVVGHFTDPEGNLIGVAGVG